MKCFVSACSSIRKKIRILAGHALSALCLFSVCWLVWIPAAEAQDTVVHTKHNLSVSGPGELVASEEVRVCIFCHTPHRANAVTPLWNREVGGTVYDLYASTTLNAAVRQPTGTSRLCLSCHDGTIALGMLYGRTEPVPFVGNITTIPMDRPSNLQTDLSDDHPVSFSYTSTLAIENGELVFPSALPSRIRLEYGEYMQCTSCHNPHKDLYGKFLVMSNEGSALCMACHEKYGWQESAHSSVSSAAEEGCENCHVPHNAPVAQRLLNREVEEDICLVCHDRPENRDIASVFSKAVHHPLEAATGVHDAGENPLTAPYHVECVDCHNAHSANNNVAAPPAVMGDIAGVKGVDISGNVVDRASREYEVCFRCHADNSFVDFPAVPRQIEGLNKRLVFDPVNPSYHPVAAVGQGLSVPSLRPEYNESSMIYCIDCHNSDDSARAGGSGPEGPHGSSYPHLLMYNYEIDIYPLTYSPDSYALCFRCHDETILLSSTSAFAPHSSHVVQHGVPCSVCHDPHGVSAQRGATAAANAHLINFDTRFVTGSYDSFSRSCSVSCHQVNPHGY